MQKQDGFMFNDRGAIMTGNQEQLSENTRKASKVILLVEDDTAICDLLVQMIRQETPYQVFAVPDGYQALELVKETRPHLLILDYRLPTINGLELYDRLHAVKGLEMVSTIMISVSAPLQEIKKRSILYIKKPFDLNILLEAIDKLLD